MRKLFIILALLIAINANAQWVESTGTVSQSTLSMASIGNNIFAGMEYQQGVFISTNNGISWTQTSLNNTNVNALATLGNNIFAGTFSSGVLVSTNNGANWTQTSLNTNTIYSLTVTGNTIYAGTNNSSIYYSTNNGNNWNMIFLANQVVYSIAFNGGYILAGTAGNGVFVSSNNGETWIQTSLNNKSVHSIIVSGINIFAGTMGSGGVFLSTNNGSSWSQTSLYNKTVWSLAASGNNIFAGIDASSPNDTGGVFMTTNNGLTWVQKNHGFNGNMRVQSLLIANNYILAGTYGQSIWRRPLSEIISIQNISTETPAKYSLSQNYPNPFNPTTNVQFSMSNVQYVSLKVFDILGKEVSTLVNETLQPGTYETTFDGSQFSSGTYFYKLSAGDFSETKKMLLIK